MILLNGSTPTVKIKTSEKAMSLYTVSTLERFAERAGIPLQKTGAIRPDHSRAARPNG